MVAQQSREVALIDQQAPTPGEVTHKGAEQARALMDILRTVGENLQVSISGRKYLRFEAWQTIARFNRSSPVTEWTRPVCEEERVVGYEARVNVVDLDTGRIVASGEAMCGLDEYVTQGQRTEIARRNAARSMAQTRAAAKGLRMAYSFVAVLAGFEPTPAEEMDTRGGSGRSARVSAGPESAERTGPPGDKYSKFFREARELGYQPKAALSALGVASISDWIGRGKTVEDGVNVLKTARQMARTA